MLVEERVHGLRGSWYPYGLRSARLYRLAEGLEIRTLSAPAFLATKWEAFEDRGAGDLHGSHDVEDVVTVIAGRGEVVQEVRLAARDVRRYLVEQTARFLDGGATPDIIAGALPDARLAPGIIRATEERLVEIAGIR